MVKFIDVERVKSMATTIEDTPKLVLIEMTLMVSKGSLQDLIFESFEGVLDNCPDFEHRRAHVLFADSGVLDEFEEMRVFDFFPLL